MLVLTSGPGVDPFMVRLRSWSALAFVWSAVAMETGRFHGRLRTRLLRLLSELLLLEHDDVQADGGAAAAH